MRDDTTTILIGSVAALWFIAKRLLHYLRFFQQEEYNPTRFFAWIFRKRAFDKKGSLIAVILAFAAPTLGALCLNCLEASALVAGALFIYITHSEGDPRVEGKLPLVMTERARRIYQLALSCFMVYALLFIVILFREPNLTIQHFWFGITLFIQLTPIWLVLANFILAPIEKKIQNDFLNEAKEKLQSVNPITIGITGSYGKTSVKSYLAEILNSTLAPTFWTQKSINTPMGITRAIRTTLSPLHRYAIFEMGAYGIGSISRLCKLAPPKVAIVTAVGTMHLERFGSRENVYLAKSELPRAVPDDGILVCCGDNEGSRKMAREFPKKTTLLYGLYPERGELHCTAQDISFSPEGTKFTILWKGSEYRASTQLLGTPAVENILGAFTMACALGANPALAAASISNIEAVENRLGIEKRDGIVFLKDAYNSNPSGFAAALTVLAGMPAKRRILMTPGMVELGSEQFDENKKIGAHAATVCDHVIIVGDTNRRALTEGLSGAGFKAENIEQAVGRSAAFEHLAAFQSEGDVILIENDLPDLYEMKVSF